ncbi:glycoside hydrolase family protein [Tenacibaculum sp. 190524A05c]|uniref:Lysozyme n=1 Tax=Tenacibaculum platacis TaxID=3137852 RepID=A0ABP1ETE3_9FLAO
MLDTISKKIEIKAIELSIENRAIHETDEYVVQRIRKAIEEVLDKLEHQKQVSAYINNGINQPFSSELQGVLSPNSNTINDYLLKRRNNDLNGSAALTNTQKSDKISSKSNLEKISLTNANQNAINFSFFTEGDEQNIRAKLIDNLRKKVDYEYYERGRKIDASILFKKYEKPKYPAISSPNGGTPDPKISRFEELISLLNNKSISLSELLERNDDLLDVYQQMVKNHEIKNFSALNRDELRGKLIKKIKELFIDVEPKKDKKVTDYWSYILQQLQMSDLHLHDLFSRHQELFLVANSIISLPEFVSFSEMINLEINVLCDFTEIYDYGISKDEIYSKLSAYYDLTGKNVKYITSDSKEVRYKPNSTLNFWVSNSKGEALKNDGNVNWVIRKMVNGKWTTYENYVDVGSNFTSDFKEKGFYLVEAYGKNPESLSTIEKSWWFKGKRVGKQNVNKRYKIGNRYWPCFLVHIKEAEFSGVKTSLKKTHIREGSSKYSFEAKSDIKETVLENVYWQVFFKQTVKDTYEIKETCYSHTITQVFEEKGCYKLMLKSVGGKIFEEKEVTVGGNWVKEISPVDRDYILFNTNDKISFKVDKYELKYDKDKDQKNIRWEIWPNGEPIAVIVENEFFNTNTITWSNKIANEGTYTVKAFSDTITGEIKEASTSFKIIHPEVTSAYWAYSNGEEKKYIGFNKEETYINATVDYFYNKEIYVDVYCDNRKLNREQIKTKTDANGNVKYKLDLYQFLAEVIEGEKLHFKIKGVGYKLKNENKLLSEKGLKVSYEKKINDIYFSVSRKRIFKGNTVPYGTSLNIIVETTNLIGEMLNIFVYRSKNEEKPDLTDQEVFNSKNLIIDKDGKTSVDFRLESTLKETHETQGSNFYIKVEMPDEDISMFEKNNLIATVKRFKSDHGDWHDPIINPQFRGHYAKWNPNASDYFFSTTKVKGKKHPGIKNRNSGEHQGNDIYATIGTPVYAMFKGKISLYEHATGRRWKRGYTLTYMSSKPFEDDQYQYMDYLHLAQFKTSSFIFYDTKEHKYEDYKEGGIIRVSGNAFYVKYNKQMKELIIDNTIINLEEAISICGKKGEVNKGDIIGYVGMTGNAKGNRKFVHLHINFGGKDRPYYKFYKEQYINVDFEGVTKSNQEGFLPSSQWGDTLRFGKRKDISTLSTSWKGKLFIKDWEKFLPQKDDNDGADNCTIGYGHLIHTGKCDGSASEKPFDNGLTEEEALALFNKDILIREKRIKNKVKVPLYQHEFDAIVSYVYNLGIGEITELFKLINEKKYEEAVTEISSKGGEGIQKRRRREQKMFKLGVYDSYNKVKKKKR